MWYTILVVCLINLLSTSLYIISSFGNAILMELVWQICSKCSQLVCSGNIPQIVFYISISTGISAPLQLYYLNKYINWNIAIQLTISQLLGGYIGITLLFIIKSIWMVRCLGIFFSLLSIEYIIKEGQLIGKLKKKKIINQDIEIIDNKIDDKNNKNEEDVMVIESINPSIITPSINTTTNTIPNTNTLLSLSRNFNSFYITKTTFIKYLTIWGVGLCAGLLGGLFGTPGPPLMLYVTRSSLSKNEIRATLAVSYTSATYERLLMMLLSSNSPIHFISYNSLYSFLGILVTCLIGRYIGEYLGKYVDESIFRRIIMGILIFGSTTMMTSGITLEYQLMFCLIFAIFYIVIGSIVYYMTIHNITLSLSSLKNYKIISKQNTTTTNTHNLNNSNDLKNNNNSDNQQEQEQEKLQDQQEESQKNRNKWNYFHIFVNRLNSYEYFHERI